jgi:chemotaxis signal transduction protein
MTITHDLLMFDVGAERFAVPLAALRSVEDSARVQRTRVPHERGVGVWRTDEAFVTVYEPTPVLGVSRHGSEPLLMLLSGASGHVGLLVDHAEAAVSVNTGALRDLSGLGAGDRVVLGALRHEERWVTLLDAGALVDALTTRVVSSTCQETLS